MCRRIGDFEGKVRLVSPEVDKTTRLGRVKIFLGSNPQLRIGSYARGLIETARSRGLGIPTSAVTFDQGTNFVQVVVDNKVKKQAVRLGLISGDLVEVKDGLNNSDLVRRAPARSCATAIRCAP